MSHRHRQRKRINSALLTGLLTLSALSTFTACSPPIGEAQKLIESGQYESAERALRGLINDNKRGPEVEALLGEALFYTQGPAAGLDQLAPLYEKHQDNKVYQQVIERLAKAYAGLDQLARDPQPEAIRTYLDQKFPDWFLERARWLQAREAGKGFATLAKSEDGLIRQLARWRQAGPHPARLKALLEDFPKSRLRPAWYATLINNASKAKNDEEVILWLTRQIKETPPTHPRRGALLVQRADALIEAKRLNEAWRDLHEFLDQYPKHALGRTALYTARDKLRPVLRAADNEFLAEQAYDRWMYQTAYAALSAVPASSAADIYKLASYAFEAKSYGAAREQYQRLQKGFPGSLEAGLATVGLAAVQRVSKQHGEAMRLLQEIKVAYASKPQVLAAALWEEGVLHDFKNRDDLRAEAYQRLLQNDPEHKEAMSALWYSAWYDYRQGRYQSALKLFEKHEKHYTKHELRSRFLYWRARCHEALKDPDAARTLYTELQARPLMDYYAHRARERLRVLDQGGDDRYATSAYQGFSRERAPSPGYERAFRQALTGDRENFSELMELYHLHQPEDFMPLASLEADSRYQVLHGLLLQSQGRYYEAVTRYRYLAEEDDAYLPAAFPLAFFDTIEAEARKNKLNPFLASGLIWQESQYKPDIKSWVGATGLMQIMPATGAGIAQNLNLKDYQLTDAKTNIMMGTWYLKTRHDAFDGNSMLAVASYNAGAGPVERWRRESGHLPYDAQAESITYPETRGYVKHVFTAYWIYQALYGK